MAWKRGAGGFNYYRSTGPRDVDVRGQLARCLAPSEPRQGPVREPPERRAADEGAQGAVEQLALAAREHPRRPRSRRATARRRHPWFTKQRAGRRLRARVRGGAAGDHAAGRRSASRGCATQGGTRRPPAPDHGADPRHADRQPRHELHVESRALRDADQVDLPATLLRRLDGLFADVLELDFPPPFFSHAARSTARAGEVRRAARGRPGLRAEGRHALLLPRPRARVRGPGGAARAIGSGWSASGWRRAC